MTLIKKISATAYLSLVAAIALCGGCEPARKQFFERDTIGVRVFVVGDTMEDYQLVRYSSGHIEAAREVKLGFETGGTITEIPVNIDQYVTKGELLAKTDDQQLRRTYEGLRAAEALALTNYNRLDTVFKKGSIAEIKMLEAKTHFENAHSAVRAVETQLQKYSRTAPFDGHVVDRFAEVGTVAGPGTPVIHLADLSVLNAVIFISEYEINSFQVGDRAKIQILALDSLVLDGVVDHVARIAAPESPDYVVKVKLTGSNQRIKPGMSCRVSYNGPSQKIGRADEKVIIVPSDAVRNDDEQTFVFVIAPNTATAKRRNVTTGNFVGTGTVIKSGLSLGDSVIIASGAGLHDGALILTK